MANAQVIYFDNFNGDGQSSLNGASPLISPSGETWASGLVIANNGIANGNKFTALLPFSPIQGAGVYTLSVDYQAIGSSNNQFLALGFTEGLGSTLDDRWIESGANPYLWGLLRESTGGSNFVDQSFLGIGGPTAGAVNSTTTAASSLVITLDTTNPDWQVAWDFNGDGVDRTETVLAADIPNINYVGLSSDFGGGQLSNFSLSLQNSSPSDLEWVGGFSNTWDVGVSINWQDSVSPRNFFQFDNVTFGQSGTKDLTVNESVVPNNVTFNGGMGTTYTMTGTGAITALGTLEVTTGTVELRNGTNNSFGGAVTIASSAKLQINTANVGNVGLDGTLAIGPALDPGQTLSVNGDFTMATSSRLELDFDDSNQDAVSVSGIASLDGNIDATYIGTSYSRFGLKRTLLTANQITGNPNITINAPAGATTSIVNNTDLVLSVPATPVQYITGVTIEAVSSELTDSPFNRTAVSTINGNEFEPNGTATHTASPDGNMWLTKGTFRTPNDPLDETPPSITFDLEGIFDLEAIDVWNYNEAGLSNRGANLVEIFIASSETDSFTSIGQFNFNEAPGSDSDIYGQIIDLSSTPEAGAARLVRFDILSNHGGSNDFVGLSEVRFLGVEFSSGLVGDFNGDEFVDLADYTVWRNNLGAAETVLPEGSLNSGSNGIVDSEEYLAWKSNFGASNAIGAGSHSATVPEPSTWLISLLLSLSTVCTRRKREY